MALGEVPSHSLYHYSRVMHHPKGERSKKNSVSSASGTPEEPPSSLLFAMQSAFREKLATQMTAQKKSRTQQHKPIETENSLLQLCEKSQKMVQKYNESYKENTRNGAPGGANRLKKLPPIPVQNGDKHVKARSGLSALNSDPSNKKAHLKATGNLSNHTRANVVRFNVNTASDAASTISSETIGNARAKSLEDSPPDVSKLRLVRNKRKHELLKMNTKHSSPVNQVANIAQQPISNYGRKQLEQVKEKQRALAKRNNTATVAKQSHLDASSQPRLTDFEKWQSDQDRERENRLAARRNSLIKTNRVENHNDVAETVLMNTYTIPRSDIEFNGNRLKPARKNVKRRQDQISSSPSLHQPVGDAPVRHVPKQGSVNAYARQTELSSDLGTPASKKGDELPSQHTVAIPRLNKPVLVRRDGRSNASSRTSTRNTFHGPSKVASPIEGETFDGTGNDSAWNATTLGGFSEYNVTAVPEPDDVELVPCRICGRKFRSERIGKHVAVCAKTSNKKRKVYNMSRARKKGTDMEKFTAPRKAQLHNSQQQARQSNWRSKHEDFIKTIRHAKVVSTHLKEGGSLADLPPPEPAQNLDYVTCDYCQRRFAPKVAERHIPRCKDIKARPAPPPAKKNLRNKR